MGGNMRWLTNQKMMSSLPITGPGTLRRLVTNDTTRATMKAISIEAARPKPST